MASSEAADDEDVPDANSIEEAYKKLLKYSEELKEQNVVLQQLLKGATMTITLENKTSNAAFSVLIDRPKPPPTGLFKNLPKRNMSSSSDSEFVTAIPRLATIASPTDLPQVRKKLNRSSDDLSKMGTPKFYKSDLIPILEERNHWKEEASVLREELDEWKRAALEAQDQVEELENALSEGNASGVPDSFVSSKGISFKPRVHHEPEQVYISDVEVQGHTKVDNKFMFAIQTTWCDRRRFEIYRRYGEFFMFQSTLLSLFPVEAGKHRASDKIIPTLPAADNILCLIGGINSKSAVEARLKLVNDYCTELLISLPPKISRSQYVLDFFRPLPGDKQLEMLQKPRSSTIELSVYPLREKGSESAFITEQYVAVSDFTADEAMGNQLSLAAREVVMVIKRNDYGWCYVSKVESPTECGWVPLSFLKKTSEDELLRSVSNDNLGFVSSVALDPEEVDPSLKYVAIDSYSTTDARQISFPEGAILVVVEKSEDGWWFATCNDKCGWVPSSFLEPACRTAIVMDDNEECLEPTVPGQQYVTYKSYTAQADDEISLPSGVTVEVVKKTISGWWTVRYKKKTGLAPAALMALSEESLPANGGSGILQSVAVIRSVSGIRKPPPRRKTVLEALSKRRALTTLTPFCELEECVALDETGAVPEGGESCRKGGRKGTKSGTPFSSKIGWEWFSQQLGRGSFSAKKAVGKLDSSGGGKGTREEDSVQDNVL